jgi:hypothetical protein
MTCNEIRELMPDLALGVTPLSADIEGHVRSCGECAAKLEGIRKTMALLDEWQAPEPSPYFDTRLKARLREEQEKAPARSWWQWIRRPAYALVATVLLVASATVYIGRGHKQNTQATVSAAPGTAVGDLQRLDNNTDLYSDFDVLDDLTVQQDQTANP